MSLKVEQILQNNQFVELSPRIYTTGAFLVPIKVENGWVWVVDDFNDDTYFDKENISPNVYGKNISDILNLEE